MKGCLSQVALLMDAVVLVSETNHMELLIIQFQVTFYINKLTFLVLNREDNEI